MKFFPLPPRPSIGAPHPERAEGAVEGEARRSGQGGHDGRKTGRKNAEKYENANTGLSP